MLEYEIPYFITPLAVSRDYREAILSFALLSVSRALFLSILSVVYGFRYSSYVGYFRGLSLIASVFLLFYFGPPEEASIVYALLCSFVAVFPILVPILVSISGFVVRYVEKRTSKELKNEVLIHALFTGLPMIVSLSYLSLKSLTATILAGIALSYRLLLLAPIEYKAFIITRSLLSLSLSLTIFLSFETSYIVKIGISFVRPSLIGSEMIRMYTMSGKTFYALLAISTYFITLLSLYGLPTVYFSLGLVLSLILLVSTVVFQEIISES